MHTDTFKTSHYLTKKKKRIIIIFVGFIYFVTNEHLSTMFGGSLHCNTWIFFNYFILLFFYFLLNRCTTILL